MTPVTQTAALVALLRHRPQRHSWSELATQVRFAGDALTVWHDLTSDETLIEDPRMTQALTEAQAQVDQWNAEGLRMVTVLDEDYPTRLLDIRESPPFLFVRGTLTQNDQGMSVVGSRKATARGHHIATAAAQILASKGMTVISGLAAGIDTTAHRTALEAGGRTVAFIGTGITRHYPAANRELQEQIAERGLVVSQFWPDASPTRHSFPIRNTAMSGYGLASIIVEATETSGTRIQARVAVDHGRPVILTSEVAETTTWGKNLTQRPGVHVVSSADELENAIEEVRSSQAALTHALDQLGAITPG